MLAADPNETPPMPVTGKLSSQLYEKLGEQVANELVDWFNQVDATYRADLREFNELNFSRFDAKLEQRLAELRADLRIELRAEILAATATLRAEMDARFARTDQRIDALADQIRDSKTSMIKWMFTFWIGTALIILGSRLAQ